MGRPDGKKPVAQRTARGRRVRAPAAGSVDHEVSGSDTYAPEVGFVDTFPIAADPAIGRAWLVHCYGMVGAGGQRCG